VLLQIIFDEEALQEEFWFTIRNLELPNGFNRLVLPNLVDISEVICLERRVIHATLCELALTALTQETPVSIDNLGGISGLKKLLELASRKYLSYALPQPLTERYHIQNLLKSSMALYNNPKELLEYLFRYSVDLLSSSSKFSMDNALTFESRYDLIIQFSHIKASCWLK
jgi:hypothetical protein